MQNLFAFFYRYAFVFLFLMFEFISIRLIINRNENQREIFLNSSTIISGQVYSRIDRIKKYFGLQKVNQQLSAENAALRTLLAQSQRTFKPDTILDTLHHQRYQLLPAEIINNSIEFRNNMITIDKGSNDGVRQYSSVIERSGIVGFVTHVGRQYSTVMSVLNSKSRVSVKVQRNNSIGNLVWNGNSPILMQVEAIPKHGDVRLGDTIVSSGYSNFPAGHPIGIVVKAQVEPGENFYFIETKLFNDLSRTGQVYVVNDMHRNEIDSLTLKSVQK